MAFKRVQSLNTDYEGATFLGAKVMQIDVPWFLTLVEIKESNDPKNGPTYYFQLVEDVEGYEVAKDHLNQYVVIGEKTYPAGSEVQIGGSPPTLLKAAVKKMEIGKTYEILFKGKGKLGNNNKRAGDTFFMFDSYQVDKENQEEINSDVEKAKDLL